MALHWIVCLIAVLPLWFLQNIIHEAAHGLTMWLGWRWKFSIYPFPSNKLGRFTWAHVTYSSGPDSKEVDDDGKALVAIMPKIVNGVFMVGGQFLAGAVAVPSVALPLAMFATFNCVDFIVGMAGIFKNNKQNDLWQFQSHIGISAGRVKLASAALIAVMGVFTVFADIIHLIDLGVF